MMLWTCCPKCRPCLWLTAPCLTEAWGPSSHTCRPTPNMNVASSSESKVRNKPPLYISDSVLSYAWSKNCASLLLLDLDFSTLARGFALLRLPKMPELRGKTFPDFTETTVDTDTIRYKDKNREKQRQKMLAEPREETRFPRKNFIKNKSWSKQTTKKVRRRKMAAKRKHNEVFPLSDREMWWLDKEHQWAGFNLSSVFVLCVSAGFRRGWGRHEGAFKWHSPPQETQERANQRGGLWETDNKRAEIETQNRTVTRRLGGQRMIQQLCSTWSTFN